LQWRPKLKCINNGKKIDAMHDNDTKPIMAARWWKNKLHDTGLGWLQDTSYSLINHGLICAFL
jgi:hypothetical protein